MDFESLLWVFIGVWFISCFYYAWRIDQVLRAKGMSILTASRMSSSSRKMVRKLARNILFATIIFAVVVLLAWLINRSS